jgi:histone H3/H4
MLSNQAVVAVQVQHWVVMSFWTSDVYSIAFCEMQACVSEFVSFITAEAGDHSTEGSRRSIDADDILWALTSLGFEHYIDPLQV